MSDPKPPETTTTTTPETTTTTPPATPPKPPESPIPPLENKEPPVTTPAAPENPDDLGIPDDLDLLDPKNMRQAVAKAVEKRITPLQETAQVQKVKEDVAKIIKDHPEYAPFTDHIINWTTHKNRLQYIKNGLPVSAVVAEAISPHLEKIGAEKQRLADEKARASGGGGTTTPPKTPGTTTDYKSMPFADVEKMAEQVKSGRYTP